MDCFAGSIFLKRRSRIRTRYRNRIRAHKMAILAEPRNYSIFDSSINRNSGAPSFPRSLRKGWETTEAHLDRKDSGRKRARQLYSAVPKKTPKHPPRDRKDSARKRARQLYSAVPKQTPNHPRSSDQLPAAPNPASASMNSAWPGRYL